MTNEKMTPAISKDEFARRLKRACIDAGLSQSELARQASLHLHKTLSRGTVHGYMAGQFYPHPENLAALAKALKRPERDLLPLNGDAHDAHTAGHAVIDTNGPLPGMVWLKIDDAVTIDAALKIMTILNSEKAKK